MKEADFKVTLASRNHEINNLKAKIHSLELKLEKKNQSAQERQNEIEKLRSKLRHTNDDLALCQYRLRDENLAATNERLRKAILLLEAERRVSRKMLHDYLIILKHMNNERAAKVVGALLSKTVEY